MKRLLVLAGAGVIAAGAALGAVYGTRDSGSDGTGAAIGKPPGPYRGSEPPPGIRAPDVTLRSYRGPLIRMRDLRGKVVLVTFLDTKCREACPIIAGVLGDAWSRLTRTERTDVRALAITVQPHLDTPLAVRRFLEQRHAVGALDFLIGPEQKLRPVWKAFHVLAAVDTGSADTHSADVRVFNREGVWVSTMHAGVDLSPANVVHDVRQALRHD